MKIFLILRFWIFLKNSVYILGISLVNRSLEEKILLCRQSICILIKSKCPALTILYVVSTGHY